MSIRRQVKEGVQHQGQDETIAYKITTSPWGSTPTDITAAAFDVTNGHEDVTSTVLPTGSPSASGDVITLPSLKSLTRGHTYRVECKYTAGGNIWEAYFFVKAER